MPKNKLMIHMMIHLMWVGGRVGKEGGREEMRRRSRIGGIEWGRAKWGLAGGGGGEVWG